MPFLPLKALGCSIRSIQSAIGWNGAPSQLSLSLVEDTANGEVFTPVKTGTPVFFEFESFKFNGLLQRWAKSNSADGYPTYEAQFTDPRELLEGVPVILGGYNGSVSTVPNVFNPFGYWENQGFGLSLANATGMPWYRVRDALAFLANQPSAGPYGGPISFRGNKYGLDLSQLPQPDANYRIGGNYVYLLDLIAQLCDDGGADFFFELDGYKIRVRTVSRRDQPILGTIAAITSKNTGNVLRAQNGLELRNETTSVYLVGGQQTSLYLTEDAPTSFWGYDVNGDPILGSYGRLDFSDARYTCSLAQACNATDTNLQLVNFKWPSTVKSWPALPAYILLDTEIVKVTGELGFDRYVVERGQFNTTATGHVNNTQGVLVWYSTTCDRMILNATPVADLLGDVRYPCSTLELRFARANMQSWLSFMVHVRKDMADRLGLVSPILNQGGKGALVKNNVVNDGKTAAATRQQVHVNQLRLYEFVKGFADEYLGRKFLVSLPQVALKTDPETGRISTSYDISQEGGYLPEGSSPLGLSALNEDILQTPDGRFRCFVKFQGLNNADFSAISPVGSVVDKSLDALFLEAQVDANIVYTPAPAALITIQPLFNAASSPVGDLNVVNGAMHVQPADGNRINNKSQFGTVGVRVSPDYRVPSAFAVPLRSNVLTYGPWYVAGAPGKVRFEQDPSLTPWEYGGFAPLQAAALARVTQGLTNMQEAETGLLELAGTPTASLGDVLQSGGPNITDIQIGYGPNGVTTTYSFRTYTPRFGVFSKSNADRLRRYGQVNADLRRDVRTAIRAANARNTAIGNAARAAQAFLQNAPKAVKKESPHNTLTGFTFLDTDAASSGDVRHGVSSCTFEEAVAFSNADKDEDWQQTTVMGLEGLIRPFSTGPTASPIPVLQAPSGGFESLLTASGLNHFGSGHDIEIYSWGDSYVGLHGYRVGGDPDATRAFALRGPPLIVGWGLDTEGSPVPSNGVGGYADNYRRRSDLWKVGPVDLLWDERRGVWTCHDVLVGKASSSIPASGSSPGTATVYKNGVATSWELPLYNWANADIASGTPIYCLWDAVGTRWWASTTTSGTVSGGSGNLPPYPIASGDQLFLDGDGNWTRVPPSGVGGLQNTQVLYGKPDGTIGQSPNFTWDNGLLNISHPDGSLTSWRGPEYTWLRATENPLGGPIFGGTIYGSGGGWPGSGMVAASLNGYVWDPDLTVDQDLGSVQVVVSPSDAFGEVVFAVAHGQNSLVSEVARVQNDGSMKLLEGASYKIGNKVGQAGNIACGTEVTGGIITSTRTWVARLYNSSSQDIPTATPTVVTFDSDNFDAGYRDPNGIVIPAGSGGIYLLGGACRFSASASGTIRTARLLVNDVPQAIGSLPPLGSGNTVAIPPLVTPYELAGGDTVKLDAQHDAGLTLSVDGQSLWLAYLGPSPSGAFSGGGGGGGGGASPPSPNLVTWLKADAIVGLVDGDPVTTWSDSSGAGDDLTTTGSPTYKTGLVNGKPAVRFNGSSQYGSTANPWPTAGFSAFAVIYFTNGAVSNAVLGALPGGVEFQINTLATQELDSVGNGPVATDVVGLTPSTWCIVGVTYDGATYTFYSAAGAGVSGSASQSWVTAAGYVGASYNGGMTDFFGGDIAEILVYDACLNVADATAAVNYLKTKYAL
jgi:hypothetical protein